MVKRNRMGLPRELLGSEVAPAFFVIPEIFLRLRVRCAVVVPFASGAKNHDDTMGTTGRSCLCDGMGRQAVATGQLYPIRLVKRGPV